MHTFRVFVFFSGLFLLSACGTSGGGVCNANTCQGCCTAAGKCEAGNTAGACGALGGMCRDCSGLGLTCTLGSCTTVFTGAGGGTSGGGGGTTGGGGGSTGGGGGTTGGGGGTTGGGGGSSMACSINNGGCAAEATCTPQGTSRVCTCTTGWVGDGFTCTDVNECLTNNGGCAADATCSNTLGGRTCACDAGFTGDGVTCTDVNECLTNNGGCSVNADCTNTSGSRTCACRSGYTGDGVTCSSSGPTWTTEIVAFSGGSTSSIAFTSGGAPAIAYTSDSPRGVYYRTRLGANSWSLQETVDASTNAMWPSLVQSSGMVVTNSVSNTTGSSLATWRRGTSWVADGTLAALEQPSMAVGNGREHLVSSPRVSGQPSTVRYVSRTAGATGWGTPTTVTSNASWSAPKLAVSPSGQLGVLYTRSSDSTLWLARSSGPGTSWMLTQITTARVWAFDLTLNDGGVASIVFYLPDGHLIQFERWQGTQRVLSASVDAPGGTGAGSQWFSGLAIAEDGASSAHVSYLDFSRGAVLRYATNRSGTFVAETVTASDDVLGETSIVVDSSGAPHISFPSPSSSFGNLGYAVKR